MNTRGRLFAGGVAIVLIMILVFSFRLGRESERKARSSGKQRTETAAQQNPSKPGVASQAVASGTPALRSSTIVMAELKHTFRPGGLPARIRLQGELSERWEKQPPTAAEVIGQIADTAAPEEHRVYIAHSFRNLAKMNRLAPKEAADVVDQILRIVADEQDAPLVRGQLAVVLAGFDKSPQAVRTIALLLNESNDDAGALAVTALRHTTADEAATALYDYLQRDAANRDAKPKTTTSALLALTGYGKVDVTPIAKEIVTQSQSPQLFQGALVSLAKAKSSVAVIEALLVAYGRNRVGPLAIAEVRARSLHVLRQHADFIYSSAPSQSPAERLVTEQARRALENGKTDLPR